MLSGSYCIIHEQTFEIRRAIQSLVCCQCFEAENTCERVGIKLFFSKLSIKAHFRHVTDSYVLAVATVGNVTQIKMIKFVSCHPNSQRQVKHCSMRVAVAVSSGSRKQAGDNLKVVWAEFSTINQAVLLCVHFHGLYKHG